MDGEQPPDPGNRDLDTSSTDDKIHAYEAIANSYQAGIQPAIFLTHAFLRKHPILLEEDCLTVNWDRIPGLYSWTDKLLTVSIADAQWEKWGQPGGWTAWELDTRAGNFIPNMAVVVCKGAFHDAPDPELQTKVGHFMTIAWVPDCINLLLFEQLWEAFNSYVGAATAVGLIRLHRSNVVFPDVYFQFYGEHFTIMGLLDPDIRFGMADEFVGGYFVCRHVAASGWRAHAMLPPSYMQGAKCPIPSPTYTYRLGGTRTLAKHPPIHIVFMAAIGRVLPSPKRFCIVEASANEWSFNDAPVPWILPENYRNPNETVPDDNDNDDNEVTEGSLGKGSGSAPPAGPAATTGDGAEESDGFEMVDDWEEAPSAKVVIRIPAKEVAGPEGSGPTGKDLLFESEEEDDPEVKKQIKATLDTTGPLGDLMLSEDESGSESGSSDNNNDDGRDPNETKQYYQG